MTNFITIASLIGMLVPSIFGYLFFYPFSDKICTKISNHVEYVLGPLLWKILHAYKKFNFWVYKDKLDELPPQFMIISNHQSFLDIPCFMNVFRKKELRFVAKSSLGKNVPLVSAMLKNQQHCIIPRTAKPMDAMNLLSSFGKQVVEKNQIPIIFPEGTRTRDGNVGKFYSAGFRKLSESSNLPIVVCALEGGYKLRELKNIFKNLKNGCYRIKVLKIYDSPTTKDECIKILDESRELIANQVNEWRTLSSTEK